MADQKTKTKDYWDNFYLELPSADDANRFATGVIPSTSVIVEDADDKNSSSDLEWIVPNSPKLLDKVLCLFPKSIDASAGADGPTEMNVLEIGCGVSQLSLCLLERLLHTSQEKAQRHTSKQSYNFVSTDFSSICIGQNRKRDEEFMSSLRTAGSSLSYDILDVLKRSAHHIVSIP